MLSSELLASCFRCDCDRCDQQALRTLLECRHMLCSQCWSKAAKSGRRVECPVCRKFVSAEDSEKSRHAIESEASIDARKRVFSVCAVACDLV